MTYLNEIIGGGLIGLASALPLIWEGRIAGVSGYAAGALRPNNANNTHSLIFIIGLVLGGLIWKLNQGALPPISTQTSLWVWGLSGLLVGFGSRLGGGCTSGHGVCGLGRASPRSLASVILFMGAAMITVFVRRSF